MTFPFSISDWSSLGLFGNRSKVISHLGDSPRKHVAEEKRKTLSLSFATSLVCYSWCYASHSCFAYRSKESLLIVLARDSKPLGWYQLWAPQNDQLALSWIQIQRLSHYGAALLTGGLWFSF